MSTLGEVHKMLRPLVATQPDVDLIGRMLVLRPTHHILRFAYVDQSLGKGAFTPHWAAVVLFAFEATITFRYGGLLCDTNFGAWLTSTPGVGEALRTQIETEALPRLRKVTSIDDFADFTGKENFPHTHLDLYPPKKLFVAAALGQREVALELCAYFATENATRRYAQHKMQADLVIIRNRLCPLILSGDIVGLAAFLHEMEVAAVRRLKLERVWQRTTFPIEERGWI